MAPTYGRAVTAARPLGLPKFVCFPDFGCGTAADSGTTLRFLRARLRPAFRIAMARRSTRRSKTRTHALTLATYTAAVFLSALLLFGVQPMFSRMVLPQLGGSPSVWSVAMVFFQSMLLAGYAYAHFLMGTQNRRLAVAAHLALLTGALFMLPLSIADWGAPPASGTASWLLGLFAVSIGLPFFALAANNPLLQTWFVRTGHREAHDPYFLYASSNIGSFLALLSYPVLLEPMFTLRTQNLIWTVGYGLLIVLIASCGILLLRSPANAADLN